VQAFFGHGPEGGGDPSAFGRIAAAASGCPYAAMCALAVSILLGASSGSTSNPYKSAAGVLGWPGGQWIVGVAGALFIGVALYEGYKGVTRKFLDEDKPGEMGPFTRRWITRIGIVGHHLARTVAFGLSASSSSRPRSTMHPGKPSASTARSPGSRIRATGRSCSPSSPPACDPS
jgi:hypothetical protein